VRGTACHRNRKIGDFVNGKFLMKSRDKNLNLDKKTFAVAAK